MRHALERENHAIALGVGFALNTDFAVDHGHDPITELLVNESLDWGAINEDALHKESFSISDVFTAGQGDAPRRDGREGDPGEEPGRGRAAGTSYLQSQQSS